MVFSLPFHTLCVEIDVENKTFFFLYNTEFQSPRTCTYVFRSRISRLAREHVVHTRFYTYFRFDDSNQTAVACNIIMTNIHRNWFSVSHTHARALNPSNRLSLAAGDRFLYNINIRTDRRSHYKSPLKRFVPHSTPRRPRTFTSVDTRPYSRRGSRSNKLLFHFHLFICILFVYFPRANHLAILHYDNRNSEIGPGRSPSAKACVQHVQERFEHVQRQGQHNTRRVARKPSDPRSGN